MIGVISIFISLKGLSFFANPWNKPRYLCELIIKILFNLFFVFNYIKAGITKNINLGLV